MKKERWIRASDSVVRARRELTIQQRRKLVAGKLARCVECEEVKPTEEFSLNIHSVDDLQMSCKDCANERGRRQYHKRQAKKKAEELQKHEEALKEVKVYQHYPPPPEPVLVENINPTRYPQKTTLVNYRSLELISLITGVDIETCDRVLLAAELAG